MYRASQRRAQRTKAIGLSAVASALFAAQARADLPSCGVDCITEQRVVLCNDSVIAGGAPSTIACTPTRCVGDSVCATFENIPAAAYPLALKGVWVVMGPVSFTNAFALDVYTETGTHSPGARIAAGVPNDYALVGNPGAFTRIPGTPPPGPAVTDLPIDYLIPSGDFRICIRKTLLDDIPNVCHDVDGHAGRNPMFSGPSATCGGPYLWRESSAVGYSGDFIIRAEIEPATMAPFGGVGVCAAPDAGVPDLGPDLGPEDVGAEDLGLDLGEGADLGPEDLGVDTGVDLGGGGDVGADLGPTDLSATDLSTEDLGGSEEDGGPADLGEGPAGPPVIDGITPQSGPADQETNVTLIGSNFVEGLEVNLGEASLTVMSVFGSTTIAAVVPQGLSPGVRDVIVTNPDGQAGILEDAFETMSGAAPVSGAPVGPGCGCRETEGRAGPWSLLMLLIALAATAGLRRARAPCPKDQGPAR